MNVLGATGLTAYFGLFGRWRVQRGDVVVVSGAAGATGSVVGQIARARGAGKVVGIAGGEEKCSEVVEKYGFDECVDYREARLTQRLREACPKGIDCTSTMSVATFSTRRWRTLRCTRAS